MQHQALQIPVPETSGHVLPAAALVATVATAEHVQVGRIELRSERLLWAFDVCQDALIEILFLLQLLCLDFCLALVGRLT